MTGSCDIEESIKFQIEIKNPCFDSSVILAPSNLADYQKTYFIRSDPFSPNDWKSAFNILYPSCGELSFNVYDREEVPLNTSNILSSYMAYSSSQ